MFMQKLAGLLREPGRLKLLVAGAAAVYGAQVLAQFAQEQTEALTEAKQELELVRAHIELEKLKLAQIEGKVQAAESIEKEFSDLRPETD